MNIKKLLLLLLLVFNLTSIYYLLIPLPDLPDLPQSQKSDEPGDTTQISHVTAYYTYLTRPQVINFYLANYQGPLRLRLNHPPEKAREIIRDTIQSYYFEEIHLPLKESLYINGYEWQNDVFTRPDKRIKNKLLFRNIEYPSKITLRRYPVPLWQSISILFFSELVIGLVIFCLYKAFKTHD